MFATFAEARLEKGSTCVLVRDRRFFAGSFHADNSTIHLQSLDQSH